MYLFSLVFLSLIVILKPFFLDWDTDVILFLNSETYKTYCSWTLWSFYFTVATNWTAPSLSEFLRSLLSTWIPLFSFVKFLKFSRQLLIWCAHPLSKIHLSVFVTDDIIDEAFRAVNNAVFEVFIQLSLLFFCFYSSEQYIRVCHNCKTSCLFIVLFFWVT